MSIRLSETHNAPCPLKGMDFPEVELEHNENKFVKSGNLRQRPKTVHS